MVNENRSNRARILGLLKEKNSPVSGTELGTALEISRVAVWKKIRQLQVEGYQIESGKRGYRLLAEPDYPTPSAPDYDPQYIHIMDEVESTMAEASGREPPPNGTEFWLARRQRQGRGRENRSWLSPAGGLYFTVLFTPQLPAACCNLHLIAAGIDVARIVNSLCGGECRFRWPNDIMIGEDKIGGLLLEIDGQSEAPNRGALGIGLNVLAEPAPVGRRTGSIAAAALSSGLPAPTEKQLFNLIRPALEDSLMNDNASGIRDRWEEICLPVEDYRTDLVRSSVKPVGLTLAGSLIVRSEDEALLEITPGGTVAGRYRTIFEE